MHKADTCCHPIGESLVNAVSDPVARDLAGLVTGPLPGTLAKLIDLQPAAGELDQVAARWADLLQQGTKAQRRKAAEAVILACTRADLSWWGTPMGHAVVRALPGASLTLGEAAALLKITRGAVQSALRTGGLRRDEHGVTVESIIDRIDNPPPIGRPPKSARTDS